MPYQNDPTDTPSNRSAGLPPLDDAPSAAPGAASDVDQRLTRLEGKLDAVLARLDGAPLGAFAHRDRGPGDAAAARDDVRRETTAAPAGGSFAGAESTLRAWFDRRPFLFMGALLLAALAVFQIID